MVGQLMGASRKLRACTPLMQQIAGGHSSAVHEYVPPYYAKIGKREVVGWGINGKYTYVDHLNFPMPGIRFREYSPDVQAIREKEKGDWKKMSIEDKKTLYRTSFCQTFAEMDAPNGQWKQTLAGVLFFSSLALWAYLWEKKFVYPPEPASVLLENRQAQLKHMIDLRVDRIEGLASKWDYENNRWKK